MKKIGLKKLRRKDPKGRYEKFGEDGRQLSEDESDEEDEEDIETGGHVRRGGKLASSVDEREESELDDIDLEQGGVETTTDHDGQNVIGIELANRTRGEVKMEIEGEGRRLSEIEGDIELREIEDNVHGGGNHKSYSSTCKGGTHKDTDSNMNGATSNPPEIKDDRGETGNAADADAEKKTDSTDADATSTAERTAPDKDEGPLGPDEVLLKLQITGLEQEIRRNVRINKNSTIKHLKETQFSKEIDEGYNVRIFHSGQMRQDSFDVEKLNNEFVHCFLSKLVKPPPSSRGSTVDEENPSTLGDIAHISIWPTLLGISTNNNGSRIEWMSHAPDQGHMTANLPNEFSDCALGIHDSVVEWPTLTGLLCGFCFFPWGMIICLLHRQTRCRRCGALG